MSTATAFVLEEEDFEDICTTAGYAIGYWSCAAKYKPGSYCLLDEDLQRLEVTRDDLQEVMIEVSAGGYCVDDGIRKSVRLAVERGLFEEIDVLGADALIQLACFQEVIYG